MRTPSIVVVRNEVDPDCEYHCDALEVLVPNARAVDYPAGERPDLEDADGVVLTGSTAGVYEADERPWIDDQQRLVRELVEREIPTLGVCFGHQIANAALGGTVEAMETTCRPVEATFAFETDDGGSDSEDSDGRNGGDSATVTATERLFEDVSPVVPVAHGDVVTEPGDEMEVIASTDYYRAFATRHRDAPLWTVQFHPEFTAELRDRLVDDFGWTDDGCGFEDVNATRVVENFASLVANGGVESRER